MQQDPYVGIARRDDDRDDPYAGIARREEDERRGNRFNTARQLTYNLFQEVADSVEGTPVIGPGSSAFARGTGELAFGDRTRSATPGVSGVAANGFAWGANNELQGLIAGAVQPIRSAMGEQGVTPGQAYQQQSQAAQADLLAARAEAPIASAGLELLTGLLNPLNRVGGNFIGRGRGLIGGSMRSAAVAAPTGTVVGFLEDEGNFVDRLDGAAAGGTAGAVIGSGAPLIINGVSRLGMGMTRLASRAYRTLRSGRQLNADEAGAWSRLLREAEEAGVSEQDIMRRLEQLERTGLGDEEAMFEVLGGNAVESARGGVLTGNPDAIQGRQQINLRQTRQPQRVQQQLREGIGSDGSNFDNTRLTLDSPTPRENELYATFEAQPGVSRPQPAREVPLESEDFSNWFAGSRAVDEAGNPLPVYHGTNRQFSDFDASQIADNGRRTTLLGDGNYFSSSQEGAANYGDRVIEARLNLRAPRTNETGLMDQRLGPYDGVIAQGAPGSRGDELYLTALDNSQIAQVSNGNARLPAVPGNEALEGFMQNPRFARLAREAAQDVFDETGQRVSLTDGEIPPRLFDAIKRRMDRQIKDARRNGNSATWRPLERLRERFVGFADEVFPDYAPARAVAEERLSAKEALELGRDIFRTENVRNTEVLARRVQGMTPEQLQAFRTGVARGVVDQMNASPRSAVPVNGRVVVSEARDASNPISRFWNRADRQEALRAAFGDEQTFERFVDAMAIETDRAATFPRVSPRTQGSSTAANQRAEAVSDGVQDASEALSGNWLSPLLRRVRGAAAKGNPAQEAEIQRILWDTVPNRRAELIAELEARRLISADRARALEASFMLSAPASTGLLNATQN